MTSFDHGALLDPRNDPPPGNRLDPHTDYGWDGDQWHRLVSAYGTEALTLCGFRLTGSTRTTREPRSVVCALCESDLEPEDAA